MRRPLCQNASTVQHEHSLTQGKYFIPAVGDVKNWNIVGCIPGSKIVDGPDFRPGFEAGERLTQKHALEIGHQSSRQGPALSFSARDFLWPTFCQQVDAECTEYRRHAF